MSSLVDWQIEHLAKTSKLIEPFNPEQINPASYDVRIGRNYYIEADPSKKYKKEELSKCGRWVSRQLDDLPYVIKPGEFILAEAAEIVKIPNNVEAVFQLKSSRGREGYEHVLSGFIDPGFYGVITLELLNVNRYHDLLLARNMLIGQYRFSYLSAIPMRDYSMTGHYQNDMTVQPSKVTEYGQNRKKYK